MIQGVVFGNIVQFKTESYDTMLVLFIVLYLLLTLLIGWWASRRVRSSKDFVNAGGKLPLMIATTGLFATWFGSETILGASSEFVESGLIGVIEDPFGAALCLILVGLFFARPLYQLQILTFNDFFRLRFGKAAELISALFIVPSYFGWIAAQLVAMAIVLQVIAGIPFVGGVVLCTVVVVGYTYIGGMWAVSITDFVQTIMIIVGLLALGWNMYGQLGSPSALVEHLPSDFFQFFPDLSFDGIVHYIAAWITIGLGSIPQQDIFQRVTAAKNVRTAVYASYLGGFLYLTIGMIPLFIGLCSKALYPDLHFEDSQLVIPKMVLNYGGFPLQVLFFGALLSAILSTTSGAILAPATVVGENLIKPYYPDITDTQLLQVMRYSVIGVAIFSAVLACLNANIYELVGSSSALSLVSLFFPLALGLYWRQSSAFGALLSMLVGGISWLYFEVWPVATPSIILGGLMSLVAMIVGSWVYPDQSGEKFKDLQQVIHKD